MTRVCPREPVFPAVGRARFHSLLVAAMVTLCTASVGFSQPPSAISRSSRTCAKECHQDLFTRLNMHGPALSRCEACHVQGNPEEHTFFLIRSKEKLCLGCHQLPHAGTTHKPVTEGKCLECHDPHGSDHPRNLRADPTQDLCLRCHDSRTAGKSFVHVPVAVGACVVCHQPHSSPYPKLLVNDPVTTCLNCHTEVADRTRSPGTHLHAAMQDGCSRCHDPHASDHKFQLRAAAPELCLTCHKETMDHATAGAASIHGALMQPGGCTSCHEPHASPLTALQRTGQPESCLACHREGLQSASGKPLTDMSRLLAENPDHHGPIREGMCTACHSPHASKHFRLLIEDYPPDFYSAFDLQNFKLCFTCHVSDLVTQPTGAGLTRFRDGEKNLHYLHVNQEKGRTCRACHEVHASTHPAHIRDAVPFGEGGWMLRLNYQQFEGGGSCLPACHQKREYRWGPISATLQAPKTSPESEP